MDIDRTGDLIYELFERLHRSGFKAVQSGAASGSGHGPGFVADNSAFHTVPDRNAGA